MQVKLSRYLSYLLRHHPEDLNLSMDEEGWVEVEELISKINSETKYKIDMNLLEKIVKEDDKGRYVFTGNKTYIRACQGHSKKDLKIKFAELIPPEILYHGTSKENFKLINETGIKSMTRQYVHLSDNINTARKVGARHGEIIVIVIDTKKMSEDGIKFYKSENGVWLTDYVDTKYFLKTE